MKKTVTFAIFYFLITIFSLTSCNTSPSVTSGLQPFPAGSWLKSVTAATNIPGSTNYTAYYITNNTQVYNFYLGSLMSITYYSMGVNIGTLYIFSYSYDSNSQLLTYRITYYPITESSGSITNIYTNYTVFWPISIISNNFFRVTNMVAYKAAINTNGVAVNLVVTNQDTSLYIEFTRQ